MSNPRKPNQENYADYGDSRSDVEVGFGFELDGLENAAYDLPQDIENRQLKAKMQDAIVRQADGSYRFRNFQLDSVKLSVVDDINEADFNALGDAFKKFGDALQWWWGDWANIYVGDETDDFKRGALYDELAVQFDLQPKTLRNYAFVCRKVDVSLRKDGLHFGHHNLVTSLSTTEQKYWLERALEGNTDDAGKHQIWSVARLRDEIKADAGTLPSKPTQFQSWQNGFLKVIMFKGKDLENAITEIENLLAELKKKLNS